MAGRRRFEDAFDFVRQRTRTVRVLTVLVAAAAAAGLSRVRFEHAVDAMLPEDSEALRTVRFLRDADFLGKVAVSFRATAPDTTTADLISAADAFAAGLDRTLVTDIVSVPHGADMMSQVLFFVEHVGELLDEGDLSTLEQRLSSAAVHTSLRRWYVQLLRPESYFVQNLMRRDPLGLAQAALGRFRNLTASLGYQVTAKDGHLVHPNGRGALLVLETAVAVTDSAGSKRLLDMLEACRRRLPAGIDLSTVCGHLHTVSNERVLRRDIRLTVTIATLGFVLLFLVAFRDLRAGAIFVIPAVSILIAINIVGWSLGRLSYQIAGLSAVMAGIAVDYGIHVYVAVRRSAEPAAAVRRIIRPVVLSALTTLSVFAAFLFAAVPGYRQLGMLALIGITLSAVAAFFVLPALIGSRVSPPPLCAVSGPRPRRRHAVGWTLAFLVSLAVAAALALQVRFDPDVLKLDGTESGILAAEEQFRQLWGGGESAQAIAVVAGASAAEAAARSDALGAEVSAILGDDRYVSLGTFWPAPATRAANLARWRAFWTPDRIASLRRTLREQGQSFGFAATAFKPFLDSLPGPLTAVETPVDNLLINGLRERFVRRHAAGFWFLSFFPDDDATVAAVRRAAAAAPGVFLVSRNALGRSVSESMAAQAFLVSGIAAVLILGIVFGFMRGLRLSLAALFPAATGVLWMLGVLVITDMGLNVANLIASIVVLGLCIDYGIFLTYAQCHEPEALPSTRTAVMLSAVTTLLGAGVLLFAQHPALRSVGVSLVAGVVPGYAAAMLGVPGLCTVLGIAHNSGGSRARDEVES